MSLMRLLSAGKTLMGSGEQQGRYRYDERYRLPKFGAKKNPFAKKAETKPAVQAEMPMIAPVPMPTPALVPEVSAKITPSPEEISAMNLKETQRMPLVLPKRTAPAVVPAQQKEHPMLRLLDWIEIKAIRVKARVMNLDWQRANPMNWMPKRKPAAFSRTAVPVMARAGDAPMQGELSLERVRVVCNDLSDADLEIVPMRASLPQPKPVRREAKQAGAVVMKAEPELVGAEV